MTLLLLLSVFVVATCGLIYELSAGTLASYLLGDSVTQFSTIIGVYLFSMGIGSFASKYFQRNLVAWFVQVEILVGVVGGFSSVLLFWLFPQVESFRVVLYLIVGITGSLVGLEIPLLMRILKEEFTFSDLIARVFTFDYIGALLASVIFPLFLIPHLGIMRTTLFFGILNVLVAMLLLYRLDKNAAWNRHLKISALISLLALGGAFAFADKIMNYTESLSYNERIIFSKSTPYQRIVITRGRDIRLFLNNNLQFSSADEYRYHEALVHPALSYVKPRKVLILGGGDGFAVREILRYPSVDKIQLVDLDPEMTRLFSHNSMLTELNKKSLLSPKLHIENNDAFIWLKKNTEQFDCIIVDFPDPSNYSLGKLYSKTFYTYLGNALSEKGIAVIQSTSPFVAPRSYWCVDTTLHAAGLYTRPYHAYVPSFGEWGYIMAMKENNYTVPKTYPPGLRFVDEATCAQMFSFPRDMRSPPVEVNKLNNQALVSYFEDEWSHYQN